MALSARKPVEEAPPAKASSAAQVADDSWMAAMHAMTDHLVNLTPYMASERRFSDGVHREQILQAAKGLRDSTSKIDFDRKTQAMAPDADPTLKWMARLLVEKTQTAYTEFERGNTEYARTLYNTINQNCIACHTRGAFGPEHDEFDKKAKVQNLSALEKASLFAATRRFELALSEYEKVAADAKLASDQALVWERALRQGLLIAVRYMQSPDRALRLLERAGRNKSVMAFTKQDIQVWTQNVRDWKNEPIQGTQRSLLEQARLGLKKAMAQQKYPMDRSGELMFMRLSSTVHDLLREPMSVSETAEALYIAGLAYEALRDVGAWTMHEDFYEECIRRAPRSDWAKQCYARYEESVLFSFSGSSGLRVPANVRKRLDQLKTLSGLR